MAERLKRFLRRLAERCQRWWLTVRLRRGRKFYGMDFAQDTDETVICEATELDGVIYVTGYHRIKGKL